MAKLTLSINETLAVLRKRGIQMEASRLCDGIEDGTYPFGRVVRKSPNGRRTFEIFLVDVEAFIKSKTPNY